MTIRGFDEVLVELLVSPKIPADSWRREALNQGYIPVCDDWEHLYALTPDGKIVYSEYLDFRDLQVITRRGHHFAILAQAAERYPQLAHIRPVRGPEDPTCPSCGGSGALKLRQGKNSEEILAVPASKDEGRIVCACGGLGWIPVNSDLDES